MSQKGIGVIFLDFRRAFEATDRTLLLDKLKTEGFVWYSA